jgi:hypothetical protein
MKLAITADQLDPKKPPKKIGMHKGKPVFEFVTRGGFNVVAKHGDETGVEILGSGPHRGFARQLAVQKFPDTILDELSKSEQFDPVMFNHLFPVWNKVTDLINVMLREQE